MRCAVVAVGVVVAMGAAGCERAPEGGGAAVLSAAVVEAECDCELSSWVVTGRARHLVLTIDCPEGFDGLDGVVEFTSEALRSDYVERRGADGVLAAPRLARMTRGRRLYPFVSDGDERVEARWVITAEQARVLQRDRVWETPYVLIGTNSNTAMVAALREAGIDAPASVVDGGGLFGEFPGANLGLGESAAPRDGGRVVGNR